MARSADRRKPSRSTRKRRAAPTRILLRWLALGIVVFVGFLYSQPLRSYLSTRSALANRAQEVRALRTEKQRLEQQLSNADTTDVVIREARRLGYVKPGERLFIVKGIAAWRRAHQKLHR